MAYLAPIACWPTFCRSAAERNGRLRRADAALQARAHLRWSGSEAADGLGLVVERLEDCQDLQHSEQALAFRRHVEEPDVAPVLSSALQLSHEHSHAGTVDVGHAGKVQDDLDPSPVHKLADLPPVHKVAIVEEDLSCQDQDSHVVHLPFHEAER